MAAGLLLVPGSPLGILAFFFGDPYGDEKHAREQDYDVSVPEDRSSLAAMDCTDALAFAHARLPAAGLDADCRTSPTPEHSRVVATFRMERAAAHDWLTATYVGAEPDNTCRLSDCGEDRWLEQDSAPAATYVRFGVVRLADGTDRVEILASAPTH
ncbi:hypothetical protein DEJ51_17855 [Streptomyces venezuelae]|uniref:Uncharacterized protein n=1 Tax=Streptomyces venezuelae TaxID=54571 RepID=A0A5P2DKX2_STRVZ|nr:hypothetical protein DEJ51_17855 [Streptomyces venezuelae]